MKKAFSILLCLVILSVFIVDINVFSYELQDPYNKNEVGQIKQEIYMMRDEYYRYYDTDQVGKYNKIYSNKFYWPIGSAETTTENGVTYATGTPETVTITSNFGMRSDPFSGVQTKHSGIDIAGGSGYNVNIIAAKSGTVVYPSENDNVSCKSDSSLDSCGGGYGNYVIIQHSDGTYTLYGHMYADTIKVRAGDTVEQGQVIGKMGSSGKSTGAHLHFEVRVGENSISATADPLIYIDPLDPRPTASSSGSFSLSETSLSLAEFETKMKDYYNRTGNQNFNDVFVANSKMIYEVSTNAGVNPEIVVVTAIAESGCRYHSDNNYWGIATPNGASSGASYPTFEAGVRAYVELILSYRNGSASQSINNRYNERKNAGCDPAGHGTPDTLQGVQSIYSWIGDYRYNPGTPGLGGCYYFDYMYYKGYCDSRPTCTGDYKNCPASSKTTICEQNDYTAWQVSQKVRIRFDVFGV